MEEKWDNGWESRQGRGGEKARRGGGRALKERRSRMEVRREGRREGRRNLVSPPPVISKSWRLCVALPNILH